jgi:hypothetical protein
MANEYGRFDQKFADERKRGDDLEVKLGVIMKEYDELKILSKR